MRGLLLLTALCLTACSTTAPRPADDPVWAERQAADSFAGLWALSSPEGEALGSLRLERDVVEGRELLVARLLSSEREVQHLLAVSPGGVLTGEGSRLETTSKNELVGELRLADRSVAVKATRLTVTCPVCELDSPPEGQFCSGCGMDRQRLHDIRFSARDEDSELDLPAFERELSKHCRRRHRVVIEDFRVVDETSGWETAGWIAAWSVGGLPVSLAGNLMYRRTYRVSCTLSVDQAPPEPYEEVLELNFLERHPDCGTFSFFLLSTILPTPVFDFDEDSIAVAALVAECVARLKASGVEP